MSSETNKQTPEGTREDRREAFIEALGVFDSNLHSALGVSVGLTRFFKIMRRDDGSWLAMLGTVNREGEPIIFFGNADQLMQAWQRVGLAMAADEWRVDRYA